MPTNNSQKISVIIPAYNAAAYIHETIESVLKQSKSPFEIIVINDGSTDSTSEIVGRYESVKLINKTNEGPAEARNTGIRESQGSWISFIDADDIWPPHKIEKLLKIITDNPDIDMVATAFYSGDNEKGWQEVDSRKKYCNEGNFFKQLYRRFFIANSTVSIKKSVLNKVGLFDSQLKVAEDLDLWFRIALAGGNFFFDNEKLLFYRVHEASITSNPLKGYCDITKVLFKYRKQAGYVLFLKRILILNLSITKSLILIVMRRLKN